MTNLGSGHKNKQLLCHQVRSLNYGISFCAHWATVIVSIAFLKYF